MGPGRAREAWGRWGVEGREEEAQFKAALALRCPPCIGTTLRASASLNHARRAPPSPSAKPSAGKY